MGGGAVLASHAQRPKMSAVVCVRSPHDTAAPSPPCASRLHTFPVPTVNAAERMGGGGGGDLKHQRERLSCIALCAGAGNSYRFTRVEIGTSGNPENARLLNTRVP